MRLNGFFGVTKKRILILLSLVFVFWIIFQIYINFWDDNPFFPSISFPNAKISELSWNPGPYLIFYNQNDSKGIPKLYSQLSDGTNERLIYGEQYQDYMIVNPLRKILIISFDKVLILDENGKQEKVFTVPENRKIAPNYYKLTDDQKELMIQTYIEGDYKTGMSYTVNLFTGEYQLTTSQKIDFYNPSWDKSISPDGTKIAEVKKGSLFVNGTELIHSAGRTGGLPQAPSIRGCYEPLWLGNDHIITQCSGQKMRIVEVSTNKNAEFDEGYDYSLFNIE